MKNTFYMYKVNFNFQEVFIYTPVVIDMSFDSQFHPKYLFNCQLMLIQLKKTQLDYQIHLVQIYTQFL